MSLKDVERRHSEDCREQERRRRREADELEPTLVEGADGILKVRIPYGPEVLQAPADAPTPHQEKEPTTDLVTNELRRRMKASIEYDLASKPALFEIGVMAMTAQSDPHASAEKYRKALIDICNLALAAQDKLAQAPDGWQAIATAPKDGVYLLLWGPLTSIQRIWLLER